MNPVNVLVMLVTIKRGTKNTSAGVRKTNVKINSISYYIDAQNSSHEIKNTQSTYIWEQKLKNLHPLNCWLCNNIFLITSKLYLQSVINGKMYSKTNLTYNHGRSNCCTGINSRSSKGSLFSDFIFLFFFNTCKHPTQIKAFKKTNYCHNF